jgi:hypothetical protein
LVCVTVYTRGAIYDGTPAARVTDGAPIGAAAATSAAAAAASGHARM